MLDKFSYLNNVTYDHCFSIIMLNVFIYVVLIMNIFSILFLFDLQKFKTLSDLKGFGRHSFFLSSVFFTFCSLAGIPPFAGFVGKMVFVIYFLIKGNFLIIFLYSMLNFFVIYFYIQNVRFLVSEGESNFFVFKRYQVYLNFSLISCIVLLNMLNFLMFLFIEDFIFYFAVFGSYMSLL